MNKRDRRSRHKFVPAALLAAALVAAGGTGAVADQLTDSRDVANDSLRSVDIKDSTVRSRDIRNESIRATDVRDGSLKAADFSGALQGEQGEQGPQGPPGVPGPQGPPGVPGEAAGADVEVYTWNAPFEITETFEGYYSFETTSEMEIPARSSVAGREFSVDTTCDVRVGVTLTKPTDVASGEVATGSGDGVEVLYWSRTGSSPARIRVSGGSQDPSLNGCRGTFSLELDVAEYPEGQQLPFN